MVRPVELEDKVAKAIYGVQINTARELVNKITTDAKDLPELFTRLQTESETAQVLIFSSYLEDKVTSLIKIHLRHLTKAKEDELFGSNGPMSSFGNRLSLSYHLGWISAAQKAKLDAFRKIRNEFAHRAFKVNMSDEKISALFQIVDYDVRKFLIPARAAIASTGEQYKFVSDDEITTNQENLCNLLLLIMNTFLEYFILPIALAYRVSPNDLRSSFDDDDNPVMALHRSVSGAILHLLKRPGTLSEPTTVETQ
jgi:hypothetical protein